MGKIFREWEVNQNWLLPPSVQELVPDGHLAHFVRDTVRESLDLSEIMDCYSEERRYPPYNPVMMTALLLYGYCEGVYSSRKLAKSCEERVNFMAVTALMELRIGNLASIDVAMKCPRGLSINKSGWKRLARQRLLWKQNAKSAKPEDKAQKNFTDPESRIMKTSNGFEQAYNAQAAVDAQSQVIVAQTLTDAPNDKQQLDPMLSEIKQNMGRHADEVSADAGYCSEENFKKINQRHVNAYIATGRQKHGDATATGAKSPKTGSGNSIAGRRPSSLLS